MQFLLRLWYLKAVAIVLLETNYFSNTSPIYSKIYIDVNIGIIF